MHRRSFLQALSGTAAFPALAVAGQAPAAPAAPATRPARTQLPRARTMCGVPAIDDLASMQADVAFIGVPYDLGHGSKPGTRLGPAAIRDASATEIAGPPQPLGGGFYDRETGTPMLEGIRIVDAG